MEPTNANGLRSLEGENGKLKKLLAEQMLDNMMLRDVNSKRWCLPLGSRKLWFI